MENQEGRKQIPEVTQEESERITRGFVRPEASYVENIRVEVRNTESTLDQASYIYNQQQKGWSLVSHAFIPGRDTVALWHYVFKKVK